MTLKETHSQASPTSLPRYSLTVNFFGSCSLFPSKKESFTIHTPPPAAKRGPPVAASSNVRRTEYVGHNKRPFTEESVKKVVRKKTSEGKKESAVQAGRKEAGRGKVGMHVKVR